MARTTIIIPHYSRIDLLEKHLPRVFEQSEKDFDVTIVDNGSRDGSVATVRRKFPQVRVIEMGRNYGFARAVNEGIRASVSPFILLLNNDVELDPEFLANLLDGLARDFSADWAAPRTLMGDDREKIDNCGLFLSAVGIARKRWWSDKNSEHEHKIERVFWASGNAALFRRSFFDKVGLFDERFFAYCEDIDLALRAYYRGKKCLYVPSAICYHWESSTWGRESLPTIYYFQRNMELAYFKVGKISFHLRHLIPHVLYSIHLIFLWRKRGKGSLVLNAKMDAWRILRGKEPKHPPAG
jgi:GT2 family glycosyltransferase